MRLITQLTNSENRKDPNVRFRSVSCVVFGLVLVVASSAYARQSAGVLLQSGLYKEEVNGDLEAAIEIYEGILQEFPKDRPVAAKAQLHIGLCYEKLGLREAQKAYQKVVDGYPEQTEPVKVAHERLSLLLRAEALIRKEDKKFNIRKIWAGSGVDVEGAPSPDGRYLSYVDWDTGDLAVYEIATGKKRRLTNKGSWDESNEFALFSRWSPDGTQIVYDWYKGDYVVQVELRIVGLDGSRPRTLFSNEEVVWAQTYDWSPDGRHILACFSKKEGLNQIVLISVADGSVRVLKTLNKYPQNMSFSPDGRHLVYDVPQREDSPGRDIYLLLTDGSREIPLVEHPADDCVLGWAPDGKHIMFASNRTGSMGAWLIAVEDEEPQGDPELVKQDMGQRFIPMGFTQDGSFYYGQIEPMVDIYTAELDPNTQKMVTPPKKTVELFEGSNRHPEYSPDGKYIAYVSTRGIRPLISISAAPNVLCIRSLETGQEREISPKLRAMAQPRWSPDGSSILVGARDYKSNAWGLYRVDIETGNLRLVVPPPKDDRLNGHEWSADGKAFYLVRRSIKDKVTRIMLREIETGKERELYRSSDVRIFHVSCSPDGKWLAFGKRDKAALIIMPAAGGEPRELYSSDQENELLLALSWMPDSKYILFVIREHEPEKFSLWRIAKEGGEPQKLGLEMEINNLSVHPDGRHITFNSGTQPKEVWVMENFLPESTAGD
jgi:Tol biopolymer transport system component